MKFGTKIWSINTESFPKLKELYDTGIIDYIELYCAPMIFDAKSLKPLQSMPVMFHAPNYHHCFNLAIYNYLFKLSIDTLKEFKEYFNQDQVIFHPGINLHNATAKDSIKNINLIKEDFDMILENVPRLAFDRQATLLAAHPNRFNQIIRSTKIKTCLDFSHAITSANFYGKDPNIFIKQFLKNKPLVYHISDNDYNSMVDDHLPLGAGNFPLEKLIKYIPRTAYVCLETPKTDYVYLSEDIENMDKLKDIITQ